MNFKGFKTLKDNRGVRIDLVMPEELQDAFFASIYSRGSLCDEAKGAPEIIWGALSSDFKGCSLVAPQQVHGVNIIDAASENILPKRPEADGVVLSHDPRIFASLRFADCAPVVLAGVAEEPWMAILHSGFRGTLQNIASVGMKRILEKHPTQSLQNVWAWIGPAIGGQCYSRMRDDPTTDAALAVFSPDNAVQKDDKIFFDIKGEIKRQLQGIGLICDKIYVYDICTCCSKEYFYSYRAGDGKKRMFLLAGSTARK